MRNKNNFKKTQNLDLLKICKILKLLIHLKINDFLYFRYQNVGQERSFLSITNLTLKFNFL